MSGPSKAHYRLPGEVCSQIDVTPSTLRRWSKEFANFLSSEAGTPTSSESGRPAHRRYTDEDLEVLLTIKGLLSEGYTYQQVKKRLEALRLSETGEGDVYAISPVPPGPTEQPALTPAVTILADTLHTVAEGQQLLLNSQQANRDLLGVLIQDNFNLKEENAQLRERMLYLERELSEVRRQAELQRQSLEERLSRLEQAQSVFVSAATTGRVQTAGIQPAAPALSEDEDLEEEERRGCLSLLGF